MDTCRLLPTRWRRIEEAASQRLIEKFVAETTADATDSDEAFVLRLGSETHRLSRADAVALREELSRALVRRREFFRTVGEHRRDGSYVVSRRAANSEGHSKVFEDFAALCRLYERLPETFTAEDVGGSGLTGGRRHMLVRHFAEHPAFECSLRKRQPLTARKGPLDAGGDSEETARG